MKGVYTWGAILVIVFASLMGLFFWVLDLILTWLIRLLTGQPPA